MEFYKIINRELDRKYGKGMFRIVQNSRSLVEKRFGNVDHFAGLIYVGSTEGIHELPKYSYIPEGFWILERLYNTTNAELISKQSYEPIWVFQTAEKEYQAPILNACLFLIEAAFKGPTPVESEEEKKKKEAALFFEMLGGKADIGEKIGMQEGVSFVGLNPKGEPDAPVLNKEQ